MNIFSYLSMYSEWQNSRMVEGLIFLTCIEYASGMEETTLKWEVWGQYLPRLGGLSPIFTQTGRFEVNIYPDWEV